MFKFTAWSRKPGVDWVIWDGNQDIAEMTEAAHWEANANLIAAAPELYELLAEMSHMYGEGYGYDGTVPILDRARDALAKARGES